MPEELFVLSSPLSPWLSLSRISKMANKDGHKEGSCDAMVTPMGSGPTIPLATHCVSSPVPVVSVPRASTPPNALKESGEVGSIETGWGLGGSDRTGLPSSLSPLRHTQAPTASFP